VVHPRDRLGYVVATGEHVAFGLSVERGASLRYEMDVMGQALVDVNDFEVLFTERAPERTDLAP
jgi:hypothetical protein